MKSILIKDTTKEEREQIVKQALWGSCGAECEFCSGCDNRGGGRIETLYQPYIDGETSVCPLARVMRYECRRRGIKELKVVYSKEKPIRPKEDMSISCRRHCVCPPGTRKCTVRRDIPGSTAFVPSVAGLIIAGEVIKDLTNSE